MLLIKKITLVSHERHQIFFKTGHASTSCQENDLMGSTLIGYFGDIWTTGDY